MSSYTVNHMENEAEEGRQINKEGRGKEGVRRRYKKKKKEEERM
jgi:hypothetical protein